MRLHEFEAKDLFREYGIPVPRGDVAEKPEEAGRIATRLGPPVVVKAQVLVGGRGRAGGIRRADSAADATRCATEILASEVRGYRPESVLVEEGLAIARELYLGIAVDRAIGRPAVVVSALGGVDIEEVATAHPEALATAHPDPATGLSPAQARELVAAAGIEGESGRAAADILDRLYQLFATSEALITEINPVAVVEDGRLVAADAVVELDEAARFRHPEWRPQTPGGEESSQGMTYVELEGEIGLICSGAGLGMATMDLIAGQARPANFLETGGGITRELMAAAMRRVLAQPGLKGILINIYGGINPIHEGARGVAEVMAEGVSIPVVAKALGNFQEETWAILEQAGVTVVKEMETEEAVTEILRQVGAREAGR